MLDSRKTLPIFCIQQLIFYILHPLKRKLLYKMTSWETHSSPNNTCSFFRSKLYLDCSSKTKVWLLRIRLNRETTFPACVPWNYSLGSSRDASTPGRESWCSNITARHEIILLLVFPPINLGKAIVSPSFPRFFSRTLGQQTQHGNRR